MLEGGDSPQVNGPRHSQSRRKGTNPALVLGKGHCEFYSIRQFAIPKEMSSLPLLDHLFTRQSLGMEGKSSMCTVKVAAKHLITGLGRKS